MAQMKNPGSPEKLLADVDLLLRTVGFDRGRVVVVFHDRGVVGISLNVSYASSLGSPETPQLPPPFSSLSASAKFAFVRLQRVFGTLHIPFGRVELEVSGYRLVSLHVVKLIRRSDIDQLRLFMSDQLRGHQCP